MSEVARVLVDTGLSHLDRIFDYSIPSHLDEIAQPGVRVKVRFAGAMREGWLIERASSSEHRLSPLSTVVSPESVLAPEIAELARLVADRFAGTATDVLRTAIPPRQAKVEKEPLQEPEDPGERQSLLPVSLTAGYTGIAAFVDRLDQAPRASWSLLPTRPPFTDVADLIRWVGDGVLVVVPDGRDVQRLTSLLADLGEDVVQLTADLPPARRYRNFLRVRRGHGRIVIGTRSAVFAPLHRPRLIIVVDDGDESHAEPHAPGWNTRAVASLRAHQQKCALIIAGCSVSVDAQALVEQGWLGQIDPVPEVLRQNAPRIEAVSDPRGARLPTPAWKMIKQALESGPVLVSAPFTGYQPTIACQRCRAPAQCGCGGRLGVVNGGRRQCRLCGADGSDWRCPHCGGQEVRATSVGADRLAEELGRAFPGTPVSLSTAEHAVMETSARPQIVISTTGVEPVVAGGYRAAIILDGDAQLARADLRAEEEARRRWFNALSLLSPTAAAMIVGDSAHPSIQALIAWAPRRAASREAQERARLHLGPAWQMATIESEDVHWWRQELESAGVEVLGPLLSSHGQRLVARHPRGEDLTLAALLKELAAHRSSRKEQGARIRIDPLAFE